MQEVDIPEFFNKRIADLETIISANDYPRVLSVFNNKGLRTIANKHFKISDFTERAIRLLQFDTPAQKTLLKYFPKAWLDLN
jgi:hypothetical protein